MTYEQQRLSELQAALDDVGRASDHIARLAAANKLLTLARVLQHDAVGDARSDGVTWREIGDVHGLTRQGAFQRFTSHEALVRDIEHAMTGQVE